MKDLTNKVAIVTGGGSGIGREVARLYAREGAKVIVADIDENGGAETVSMIKRENGEAFFIKADSSSAEENKKLVDETIKNMVPCILHVTMLASEVRWHKQVSIQ